jgi:hypothetical protein
MVTHWRRLRFVYLDVTSPQVLILGEVKDLAPST